MTRESFFFCLHFLLPLSFADESLFESETRLRTSGWYVTSLWSYHLTSKAAMLESSFLASPS